MLESKIENMPAIALNSRSPAPGADARDYERYVKWMLDVYGPMLTNIPEVAWIDGYQIVRENPEYPDNVSVQHYKTLKGWRAYATSSEGATIQKETTSWIERGIAEAIWAPAYALVQSFRSKPAFSKSNEDTRIENASIMHLEAYRLSAEEQEKYVKWFEGYACPVFMPLFIKLPGLMGYDWYEDTGLRRRHTRESEYPKYLSIVYFENMKAYESFAKSAELAAFQKAMRSVFPFGLNYKWYVQYQLTKSWRK